MFRIYDGRNAFYQWDIDRKIIVRDSSIIEVHFCNRTGDCALVGEVYKDGDFNVVNVPNILLQTSIPIRVYGFTDNCTKYEGYFDIIPRTKPADYVYTETEVKCYENFVERLEVLERDNIQVDWAQNDESAKDFIKNRTHYEEIVDVEEVTLGFGYDDTRYTYDEEIIDSLYEQRATAIYMWGDTALWYLCDIEGTKEYYITNGTKNYQSIRKNKNKLIFKEVGVSSSPFLKITFNKITRAVHKLDAKYLPLEGYATETYVNNALSSYSNSPLLLDASLSDHYGGYYEKGDEALEAIKKGRQILVKVPNASGDNYVASYSPVYMYQVPNYANQYLYLFFLRDEKQTLDLTALGMGTIELPTYGQLKMLLSQEYNYNPLA